MTAALFGMMNHHTLGLAPRQDEAVNAAAKAPSEAGVALAQARDMTV